MYDAATEAIPNFTAALSGKISMKDFYREVGRYRLRVVCRPTTFLFTVSLDALYNEEDHTVEELRAVIHKIERAWNKQMNCW